MSKLVMYVGLSGSGKSTHAKQMQEQYEGVIVSSDEVRQELLGDVNDQSQNGKVFDEVHRRIIKALELGKTVYYDATNLSAKRRKNFLKQIDKYVDETECIVMAVPYEICIANDSRRRRNVGEKVIMKQLKKFQCPYWYEGWTHIEVVGEDKYDIASLMAANDIPHDCPYHDLGVLEHMEKALQIYMNCYRQNPEKKYLEDAILCHDIGKFLTKEFDDNGVAHYYNHHNVGAYLYLCSSSLHLSSKLRATMLIQWHMEKYMRNEKGMDNLYEMFEPLVTIKSELEIINQVDILAH